MEEKTEKEFTIRDRRTSASSEEMEKKGDNAASSVKDAPGEAQAASREEAGPQPEIDFMSFIISLATTAQISLGNIPNPQTNKTERTLPAAKQMIDIIAMLKEKTKGNVSEQEQVMLDNALFNLRMQYVKAVEEKNK